MDMYEEREYRDWVKAADLVRFTVTEKETDLLILADKDLSGPAKEAIGKYRAQIEDFIKINPAFKESLKPIEVKPPPGGLHPIIKNMLDASKLAGVGPMAAVAGAMAEFVGKDLLKHSKEVIVENGGDIFLKSGSKRSFGIFAGKSPLTGKLTFEIISSQTPLGICTSSGTVGHSLSFGKADAVVIISGNTSLADAAATAACNLVKTKEDLEKAVDFARDIDGILAAIIVIEDKFASWGRREFQWSLKK